MDETKKSSKKDNKPEIWTDLNIEYSGGAYVKNNQTERQTN